MTPENEKILKSSKVQARLKRLKKESEAALQRSKELLKNIPEEFLIQLEENKNENR
jgi:hypothetical protein